MTEHPFPALPYRTADGSTTTGHSQVATSRTRAEREAADGTAEARQRSILTLLAAAGPTGLTWKEISVRTGEHHGQVSGSLSSLHKTEMIAALKVGKAFPQHSRNGSGVYVLPEHVQGRMTRPFRPNFKAPAPERPRLRQDELHLLGQVRDGLRLTSSDQPTILVRTSTLTSLMAMIDRLNA